MSAVDKYTGVLARNMPQTFTQPFDAVHDNIGMSQIVYWLFPMPKVVEHGVGFQYCLLVSMCLHFTSKTAEDVLIIFGR